MALDIVINEIKKKLENLDNSMFEVDQLRKFYNTSNY